MITVRAVMAFAIVMVLAACQQPGERTSSVAKNDPLADALASAEEEAARDYQPTPAYKIKVKDLMVKMTDRMLTACIDATTEAEMSECFRERQLAGFDRDGTLRSKCKPQADVSDNFKCIIFGGVGNDVHSKLVDKAAAPFDWTAPEQSARLAIRQLVLEQLRDCLSSGSASDPFDCFTTRITTVLELSDHDLEPCAEYMDDDSKFGQCVGESYIYKYMNAGVARM